jgi:hypothetical protein
LAGKHYDLSSEVCAVSHEPSGSGRHLQRTTACLFLPHGFSAVTDGVIDGAPWMRGCAVAKTDSEFRTFSSLKSYGESAEV